LICIAAAECSELGGGCLVDEQCCQGYFCGEAGTCIAGAECSGFNTGCDVDDDCCSDLVCNSDGLCIVPGGNADGDGEPNSGGGGSTEVTELPGTGSGSGISSTPWLAGAAAVTAGAALFGGARLRSQPDPVNRDKSGSNSTSVK
jgi:hypothetical protein